MGISRTFIKSRETKNKVVFIEEGDDEAIGTLYITKTACKELEDPDKVTIEISRAS